MICYTMFTWVLLEGDVAFKSIGYSATIGVNDYMTAIFDPYGDFKVF